jgi:uncharacterized protein (DUF2249 family)
MLDVKVIERVIEVCDIEPRLRHQIIFQLFEHLHQESSLQLVVDHDPQRLRFQLETQYGSRCDWSYLERGPDIWRVRLRHLRMAAPAEALREPREEQGV